MDRVKLGFLAGYFIGKGCVTFLGPNNSLYVRIGASDKEMLENLKESFGGSLGKQSKIRQQVYYWALSGHRAKDFLSKISEFMVGPKQEVVSLALNYPCGTQNHRVSASDMEIRKSLRQKIQAINQRSD